jgi:hypothetical protein
MIRLKTMGKSMWEKRFDNKRMGEFNIKCPGVSAIEVMGILVCGVVVVATHKDEKTYGVVPYIYLYNEVSGILLPINKKEADEKIISRFEGQTNVELKLQTFGIDILDFENILVREVSK